MCNALKIAAGTRGGSAVIDGLVFHTDRGSTYTARHFTGLRERLRVRQAMGGVGSCFDNAAAEAREVLVAWCLEFYNVRRRHSSAGLQPPADYEKTAADQPVAA